VLHIRPVLPVKLKRKPMDNNVKTVIENSKIEAEKLIHSTSEIRKAFAVDRPNSSQESTVDGTLEAFSVLVSQFNPGYTPR
jgi:hypothetical protein